MVRATPDEGNEVLSTFALYSHEARVPTEEDLATARGTGETKEGRSHKVNGGDTYGFLSATRRAISVRGARRGYRPCRSAQQASTSH
jgi:hypothetical protein